MPWTTTCIRYAYTICRNCRFSDIKSNSVVEDINSGQLRHESPIPFSTFFKSSAAVTTPSQIHIRASTAMFASTKVFVRVAVAAIVLLSGTPSPNHSFLYYVSS